VANGLRMWTNMCPIETVLMTKLTEMTNINVRDQMCSLTYYVLENHSNLQINLGEEIRCLSIKFLFEDVV
jgi:hypothetical protein